MITQKRMMSLLMAVLFAGVYAVLAFSDEGHAKKEPEPSGRHGHQPPHGGKMATMGSHHVEVVVDKGSAIKIFLYDEKDNPVQVEGVSGQLHLTFPDKHRETLELAPSADQTHLSAGLKDQSHQNFKAVLSLVIDGKRQNVRFSH